jgi:formylglycine-generating enzyme required for sulfatase activity
MDAILFHPETSTRRALILALGTYGIDGLSLGERESLSLRLLDAYRNDPDAGIHGAAEWTLRQWQREEELKVVDTKLSRLKDRGARRWYVNGQGQTFAVIAGPVEFRMGSPPNEPERGPADTPHRRVIPRRFAIAGKELTVEQYQRFARRNPQFDPPGGTLERDSPDPTGPMIGLNWYRAVAYCNWLSREEGVREGQWCYLPNEKGEYAEGMMIPADALQRTGYRLPTEAEWEYACRAGTVTSRYYGLSVELLGKYERYRDNSQDHAWRCGSLLPNDLGLFDTLGNVSEWCHDRYRSYQPVDIIYLIDYKYINEYLNVNIRRIYRGLTFSGPPVFIRAASRDWNVPSFGSPGIGLRPARTIP